MSSDAGTAVHVEGLGKRYVLGRRPTGHLRDRIAERMSAVFLRRRDAERTAPRTLWALRDVSFDVVPGEVVGVIGGNGAGKSTLLKILSRITTPTEGLALIRGRVGSLLEVGTGFHPDLTGRENVMLNGAILGMRRAEIAGKFDAIVDFAEVAPFIDTPVKHYSSGMYVRLAFAVAAHLEPEILIVDEVLAVGDARFQRKCLGKIDEVARGGRTVLFVSHNLAAVQRLCTRALLVAAGRVTADGPPSAVVAQYLTGEHRARYVAAARTGRPQVLEAELVDGAGRPLRHPVMTDALTVRMRVLLPQQSAGVRCGIGVLSADAVQVFTSNLDDVQKELPGVAGEYTVTATIPPRVLLEGDYHVATCLWNPLGVIDLQEPAFSFAVGTGDSPLYAHDSHRKGLVHVPCEWTVQVAPPQAVEHERAIS
jgi:lipopolysaccharide transport system ATP-binding protein